MLARLDEILVRMLAGLLHEPQLVGLASFIPLLIYLPSTTCVPTLSKLVGTVFERGAACTGIATIGST